MSLAALSPEEQSEVQNWSVEVREGRKKILELLEALKTDLTNTDLVEKGLTKLILVLKELPKDLLDEQEVGVLLQFLIEKLEASALRNGCVVIGVHHLILHSTNLPQNCEAPMFQSIYGDGTVQSFNVSDRVLLFEILEFFLNERLSGLQNLGSVFVYCFMRAVNGERDPRCLFQIFQLFLKVVKNFDLGVFCEDFFEIMAAYFPLQYIPTEDQVPKETLAALLESCLLSHNSFSFFCFSLIADRLSDSSEDANEALEVLNFLTKAAKIFNNESMRGFVDDYLTIFRRIALDPSDKTSGKEIHENIKNAVISVFQAFGKEEDTIKQMSNTMTENCEPFVLQAEMGLTGKALNLLSVVATDTVNAPQNRREIVLEAIHYVPEWLTLALKCDCSKLANDSLPGFIEGLKQAEEKYGSEVYEAEYKLASIIFRNKEIFSPFVEDVEKLMEKLIWRAPTDLKLPSKSLKSSIHDFIVIFSTKEFEKLDELLKKEKREVDESMIELYSLIINDDRSFEKFKNCVLGYLIDSTVTEDLSHMIVQVFERNKGKNNVNLNFASEILDALLREKAKNFNERSKTILSEMLQNIFLTLPQSNIEDYCNAILKSLSDSSSDLGAVTYLALIQSHDIDLLNKAYLVFAKSNPNLLKFFHFTRIMRGWKGTVGEEFEPRIKNSLLLVQNKAEFLRKDGNCTSNMESLLNSFLKEKDEDSRNWNLIDLFDFGHPGFDPEKNNFDRTVLWRQRFLFQSLPIFVKYFSLISKDANVKKSVYLESLYPILENSKKIEVTPTQELLKLFPIFVEGLDSLRNEKLLELILYGLIQLLQQTNLEDIPKNELQNAILNIQKIIENCENNVTSLLKCFEVLELIAKKGRMELLLPFFSSTVKSLVKATGSKKRLVRQKAAMVRNLWELTVA